MYAVIDCGTTNTRVYILNEKNENIADSYCKVGVRDTSITKSKDILKNGVRSAILEAVDKASIHIKDIEYAIAFGMITSEIGLLEIPHLVAPVGLSELADNVKIVDGKDIINLDIPIMFIRGVRNNYDSDVSLENIDKIDFMRGEETQVIGILEEYNIKDSVNILVLSSHTKVINVDKNGKIQSCMTTLSGQLYEAIINQTNVGVSLKESSCEISGGYSFEKIVRIAEHCVDKEGLVRCFLIPRFMQILLTTDYKERQIFVNAAIAIDDMRALKSFESEYNAMEYILFGPERRCELYGYLLKKEYDDKIKITSASSKEILSVLSIKGAVKIANYFNKIKEGRDFLCSK